MLNNKYNIPIEDISYKKLLLYCVKYHGFDEHIIKEIIKTMIIDDSFNINEFLNSFENVYDRQIQLEKYELCASLKKSLEYIERKYHKAKSNSKSKI